MKPHTRPLATATLALATLGLLHGCALGPPPAATQTAIDAVLQQAQAPRPAPPVPEALTRALLPPLTAQQIAPAAIVEPRFDLHVTDAPLPQVLHAIGSGSRYSMLVSPALAGSVSLNLREVTVREALNALQELHGIEYRIEGTRIFVQPATLQTRLFQVSYPAARRQGRSETRVVSGSITANAAGAGGAGGAGAAGAAGAGSAADGSQVSTTQDADFWREVEAALRALVGAEGGRHVTLSPHSGVVVVRAFPAELREVERFLQASRIAIERQVMLEAKIVEVALREGFESGINWANFDAAGNHRLSAGVDASRINIPGSLGRQAGIATGSLVTGVDASTTPATVIATTLGQLLASPLAGGGSGALGLAFTRNSFAALLSFMETHGSVQVLSSPRVAVTNNQKALLRVGSDDFFITNVSTSTTTTAAGSVTTPTIQTQAFFSGIALDVTPQIDESGQVTLHIRPSVSNVSERTRVINLGTLGNFTLPLASAAINEADTIVRVQDGVTVAIGGLMSQTQSHDDARVPGAGDLPGLGSLFRREQRDLRKRELVFLLRPTVIQNNAQWARDVAQTSERIRAYPVAPRERLALPALNPGARP